MQYDEIVALLPDYLTNKLSHREQQLVEESLQNSEELRFALASHEDLHQAKANWADEEIPNWHRTAFLARKPKGNTNWMNWFSMATSMAAILLVVFRIQIVSNIDGYQVSFGEQTDRVTFKKQAANYLDDWQIEQAAYIDHRLLEFENEQLQQNQQLVSTAFEFNRSERHNDLQQLTSYFVQQRKTDRATTSTQYKKLHDNQTEDRQDIQTLYASIEK
jgi:uncharacterized membrane protein YhdT